MKRVSLPATVWVDLAVVTALSLISVIGFEPAFGPVGYLIAAIGGLVLSTAVAVGCYLFRLSILPTVVVAVAVYFLFGSPLTMPHQSLFGVLPSVDTLSGLVVGAIFGWSDVVTLQAPVEAPPYVAVVPYVATWIVGMVGTSLACRWLPRTKRTPLKASILLIGPVLLFLATILLGTFDPYYAGIRGVAFAAIALVWLGWRRAATGGLAITVAGAVKRRKLVGIAIVVVGAVVVGGAGGVLLAPAYASRYVLRQEVVPPFDPLQYPSPLAGFRNYTKKWRDKALFTVDGLVNGQRVRLATLDSYNGQVWSVAGPSTQTDGTGGFELLGRNIPRPEIFTPGAKATATFHIDGYDDIWLPNVGYMSTLDFTHYTGTDPKETVRINTASGSAAVTSGVSDGMTYREGVIEPKIPSDKALTSVPAARIQMPTVTNIPDVVAAKAEEYAGSAKSVIQKLRNIERSLKKIGYLSHGLASDPVPSRAGEGADRMAELFSKDPMVGDQEQYASAFALMARHLGYPSRVVMGFKPKVPDGAKSVTVKGKNVTAWAEVAFEGVGWVPFYPTPTKTDAPKDQTTRPKLEPQPQVRQPPRSNQKQDEVLTPVKISDKNPDDKKDAFELPAWVYWWAGIVGIPLLIYAVAFLILFLLKRRRRRRREETGPPDRRAAGSWDELSDRFAELGIDLPVRATRIQQAHTIDGHRWEQHLAEPDDTLVPLAQRVDGVVFSAGEPDAETVEALWHDADASLAVSLERAGWLRRQIAQFRYRRQVKKRVRSSSSSKRAPAIRALRRAQGT